MSDEFEDLQGHQVGPTHLVPPSVALAYSNTDAASPGALSKGSRDADLLSLQGFRVGPLCLLIGYEAASELTEMGPVYRLPNVAPWCLGVANLHGNLVPVFDLARLFDVEPGKDRSPMLLVLGHGDAAAAVVIDDLPARLKFPRGAKQSPPQVPAALERFVKGAYLLNNEIWLEFDAVGLFQDFVDKVSQ